MIVGELSARKTPLKLKYLADNAIKQVQTDINTFTWYSPQKENDIEANIKNPAYWRH